MNRIGDCICATPSLPPEAHDVACPVYVRIRGAAPLAHDDGGPQDYYAGIQAGRRAERAAVLDLMAALVRMTDSPFLVAYLGLVADAIRRGELPTNKLD